MLRYPFAYISILLSPAAFAQQDTTDQTLPIEEVVVTGQFLPTSLRNSVYKIRVIDRETIDRRGTADMTTLLNTELGFRFSHDLVLGETDIQLMGSSGNNIKILIDGVPIIDRGSSRQSLSQIDLNDIQRIEIVEGPVSVMYGTDALVGVINIITHAGVMKKNTMRIQARLLEESASKEYRAFRKEGRHNANVGLDYAGKVWSFGWSGSRNNFGGFQGNRTGRSLQWQPKDQWLTSGKVGYMQDKFQVYYNLNYLHEDIFTPGNININNKYADKNYVTNRYTHNLQSGWQVSDKVQLTGSVSYQDYERRTKTRNYDLNTQTMELPESPGLQDVSKFQQVFGRVNGLYKVQENLGLMVGLEFDYDKGSGARIQGNADIYDFAAYLSAEYHLGKRILMRPGIRMVYNSIYPAPPIIPAFNTKVLLAKNLDLRLGYAMGYRAPALRELYFTFHDTNHSIDGNTNLKAERNHNINMNLNIHDVSVGKTMFHSSLTGFYNHFNNLISIGESIENPGSYTYLNIGKYKTMGTTLENRLTLHNTSVNVGFSYLARLNQVYDYNKSLGKYFWTPELNSSISQEFPKLKANISVFYKLYGTRPSFRTQGSGAQMQILQAEQAPYSMLDISISKSLYRDFTLLGGVRNLTNTVNITNSSIEGTGAHSVSSSSIPISYGRSVFFGLQYQFNN